MRLTTETLSQVTNLLAIVSAPPIQTTTIRHIEVLLLQPQVLMVVIITSTGGVSKRVFTYERPVDPGLADWAAAYLNEALVGKGLGARTLRSRLTDPTLPPTERAFLEGLAPAFTELAETAEDSLYVDGTARLLAEHRFQDVSQLNALLEMLERRVRCSACSPPRSTSATCTSASAARTRCPRCTACRSWPPTTGCRSATSARCR